MKLIFKISILVLLICITIVHGWTALEQTDNSKPHPGECYSETKGVGALKAGEEKRQDNACVRINCAKGGLISYAGCGVVLVPPNCKVSDEDLSQSYPDCCPKMQC